MSVEITGEKISQDPLGRFHQGLKAAVLARVPLELGKTESSWFPGGNASEAKLNLLQNALQDRLASGQSPRDAAEAAQTMPGRYRAALRVFVETGSMDLVLDGLATRARSRRQLSRLIRSTVVYLLCLIAVAVLCLSFFANFIVPTIEFMREDMRLLPAVDAPDRMQWLRLLPRFVTVLAFAMLGLLVLLLIGGSSKVAAWLGGNRYQIQCAASTAVRTIGALVSRGMALDQAATIACDMVGGGSAVRRQVNLSVQNYSADKANAGHLDVLAGHFQAAAANRYAVLQVILPISLVTIIGGSVTLTYSLAIFWPVVSLLKDLTLPGT